MMASRQQSLEQDIVFGSVGSRRWPSPARSWVCLAWGGCLCAALSSLLQWRTVFRRQHREGHRQ